MVPPPFLRSSQPASDWTDFFGTVGHAIDEFYAASGLSLERKPLYVEEYPQARDGQFDLPFAAIVWKVLHSEMAPTSNNKERVPNGLTFVERDHPEKAGYKEVTASWHELMVAEFEVYGKSNDAANSLCSWFHRTLMRLVGLKYFKAYGIDYFRFVERTADEKTNQDGQDLYLRRLRYEVRITLTDTLDVKTIESVGIRLVPLEIPTGS